MYTIHINMDPVLIAGASSVGSLVLDKICLKLLACFVKHRKRDRAIVAILGKTELCKSVYNLHDENFHVVDVEGETMNSLKDETKIMLAELEKTGNFAQRNRLFNLYAKAYVIALRKNFRGGRFLFVTSSHAMASFACGIEKYLIHTVLPTCRFCDVITADMDQLDRSDFETKKTEALRKSGDRNLLVFDSWESLTQAIINEYKLSLRL